jgi:hypothetical protein
MDSFKVMPRHFLVGPDENQRPLDMVLGASGQDAYQVSYKCKSESLPLDPIHPVVRHSKLVKAKRSKLSL